MPSVTVNVKVGVNVMRSLAFDRWIQFTKPLRTFGDAWCYSPEIQVATFATAASSISSVPSGGI